MIAIFLGGDIINIEKRNWRDLSGFGEIVQCLFW